MFNCELAKAENNVLGENKGYWSASKLGRKSHAPSARVQQKPNEVKNPTIAFLSSLVPTFVSFGELVFAPSFPTDEKGWGLPPSHIPKLTFSADSPPPSLLPRGKVLTSWQEYYAWRGLPAASIAALILEFPLTLYFAITQLPRLMAKETLIIHLLGAEKELLFLPIFSELSLLLHHTSIRLVLFGDEVVRVCNDAPASSLLRARGPAEIYSYSPPPSAVGGASRRLTIGLEPEEALWQAAMPIPGSRRQRPEYFTAPDLVFAPNGGLQAYGASWMPAMDLCGCLEVPFASTEYCESSMDGFFEGDGEGGAPGGVVSMVLAELKRRSGGVLKPTYRRMPNKFRNPGQRQMPITTAPNFSNGFMVIIDKP